jgi:SAM-dependent methyltransferase
MMLMRSLKRGKWIRAAYRCVQPLLPSLPSDCLRSYIRFWKTFVHYRRLNGRAPCALEDIEAQIGDWHATTPLSFYFYQDTWAFRKIVERRPRQHVDIGSTALLVGCIAGVTPTISIDVRPLKVCVPGLEARAGNIVEMPFPDNSIASLSALCVIEHIGLGRYGDPVDPDGTRKAARELARVLAPGGDLYVSAPVGRSYVAFNAHRSFTRNEFEGLFPSLTLIEYQIVNNNGAATEINPDPRLGLHVGLFHFRK